MFSSLENLILLVALVGNIFLAFAVHSQKKRTALNALFVILNTTVSVWLLFNYISVQQKFIEYSLFFIRFSIFFATPISILFFTLAHTLPKSEIRLKRKWKLLIGIIGSTTMILALTPYTFKDVLIIEQNPHPVVGPGIVLFTTVTTFFSFLAVYTLTRKFRRATGTEREQIKYVLNGIVVMLSLIITTVLVPTILFNTSFFVKFIPLYTLFFLSSAAYAIVRHHLFNIQIIATKAFTIVLWIVLFAKIFGAQTLVNAMTDGLIFAFTVMFGWLLIRSVAKEVRQREQLQKMTTELTAANKKLEIADQMKTQFLSFASHQVKSPMTVVKGYAELIEDGSYGKVPEKVRETAKKIKESSDRLIALVNNLLDLRKLEEGRIEYKFESTDLSELLKSTVEELRSVSDEKGILLILNKPDQHLIASVDKEKIRQVFQNLIDNAIKYTKDGSITVDIKKGAQNIIFSVSDTGMGIPLDIQDSIFEQFNRGTKESKKIQGTGLGLYIAKQFVLAHKGAIKALSLGEGKGSQFIVTLPSVKPFKTISASA